MCIALSVYFEARSQQLEGQLAVAQVILNRVESPRYPNTACEVVWQERQFSWTHDGKSDTPRNLAAWEQAKRVASLAAYDGLRLPELYDVVHYHADYISPVWSRGMMTAVTIGQHVFLKE
jgi:spore germination cell wall hydrolase CwlJ-like protein